MITWVLAMEIAQRHKAVLLVNFGLKVSIVLKEGHVHTHVYVCVCVHMCVCERQLYQQAASFIYIYEGRVRSPLSSLLHWSWEKNSAMTHHTLLHLQRSREDEQASLNDQWRTACNGFFIEENGLLLLRMTAYHESHYDQILEPLLARDTLNYDIEQPPFVAFSERPGWKAATRLTGQSAEIFCVASGYI